jgi:AAA+ ATPase superfamily predicted ATPase
MPTIKINEALECVAIHNRKKDQRYAIAHTAKEGIRKEEALAEIEQTIKRAKRSMREDRRERELDICVNQCLSGVKKRLIVVIDEFPYLIDADKAIVSLFQRIWDLYLNKSTIFLILMGSSIGMMENEVLGYKSPLYGRRTGQWKVETLRFKDLKIAFFPRSSRADTNIFYSWWHSFLSAAI